MTAEQLVSGRYTGTGMEWTMQRDRVPVLQGSSASGQAIDCTRGYWKPTAEPPGRHHSRRHPCVWTADYGPLATAVFRYFAGGIVPLVVRAAGLAPLLGPSLSRDLHQ